MNFLAQTAMEWRKEIVFAEIVAQSQQLDRGPVILAARRIAIIYPFAPNVEQI